VQLGDASAFSALPLGGVDFAPGTPTTGTFTIMLDANDSLVINKGITSSGGIHQSGWLDEGSGHDSSEYDDHRQRAGVAINIRGMGPREE
jgi:hypothetical protein